MANERDFQIRTARPEEYARIRELTLASYEEYANLMEPSAWAALRQALVAALDAHGPAERIVATRAGVVIGSVMLYPPATDAYGDLREQTSYPELRLLAVAPAARGQGVGRALIGECLRRAGESGARALSLHTSDSMAVAMRLYHQMGFVRAPEDDFQPAGAELVKGYRCPLSD